MAAPLVDLKLVLALLVKKWLERAPRLMGFPTTKLELCPLCVHCGNKATSRCGQCRVAAYCGAACQRAHWKTHKPCCGKDQTPPRMCFETLAGQPYTDPETLWSGAASTEQSVRLFYKLAFANTCNELVDLALRLVLSVPSDQRSWEGTRVRFARIVTVDVPSASLNNPLMRYAANAVMPKLEVGGDTELTHWLLELQLESGGRVVVDLTAPQHDVVTLFRGLPLDATLVPEGQRVPERFRGMAVGLPDCDCPMLADNAVFLRDVTQHLQDLLAGKARWEDIRRA